jgi:tetraacyldisaccharide 4'-kinase
MNVPLLLRIGLWPFSLVYGAAARFRAWLYASGWLKQRRLKGIVISVGNLTIGGTGKTPMVIWLAERFLADGKQVAILSRGYRGTGETSDEVEVMKRHLDGRVAFGVGKNRYAQGRRLEHRRIEIFLLDDGFQHLQLARDFDIVLIDSTRPLRQQSLLPAGSLREPVAAVSRADLVLFTRTNHAPGIVWAMQQLPQFPIFPAITKLIGFRRHGDEGENLCAERAAGPFYAFCGIGNAEAFFHDLEKWRISLAGRAKFRDHHRYTARDISNLEKSATEAGATAVVTTEKDAQNLGDARFARLPLYVTVMTLDVPDEEEVLRRIKGKIYSRRGVAA